MALHQSYDSEHLQRFLGNECGLFQGDGQPHGEDGSWQVGGCITGQA